MKIGLSVFLERVLCVSICRYFEKAKKAVHLPVLAAAVLSSACFAQTDKPKPIEIDAAFLEKELGKDPSNIVYSVILAKYYLQSGETEKSLRIIQKALMIEPGNRSAKSVLSRIGRYRELQSSLGKKGAITGSDIESGIHSLLKSGSCNKMREIFILARGLDFEVSDPAEADVALCYASEGKADLAKKIIDNLPRHGSYAGVTATKILISMQERRVQNALELYKRLAEDHPGTEYVEIAKREMKRRMAALAKEFGRKALDENSTAALKEYLYLISQLGREREADLFLERYLKKFPQNREVRTILAKRYYWRGDYEKALKTVGPGSNGDFETRKLSAIILYEKGDYRRAAGLLMRVAEEERSRKERYGLLLKAAFSYFYLDDIEAAKRVLDSLPADTPPDKEVLDLRTLLKQKRLYKAAVEAYGERDFEKALRYFKLYLRESGDYSAAKEIAQMHYFRHEYGKSVPYFEIYSRHNDPEPEVSYQYATALQKLGRFTESAQEFRKIALETSGELSYLAKYHYAYSLMQLKTEREWILARETLQMLRGELKRNGSKGYRELERYTENLLKKAMDKPQRPRYYKDIVLTEGAEKRVDTQAVFSDVFFMSSRIPPGRTLIHAESVSDKGPEYSLIYELLDDGTVTYENFRLSATNLLQIEDISYSAAVRRYLFGFSDTAGLSGNAVSVEVAKRDMALSIGVEQIDGLNTVVPSFRWTPRLGVHSLYIEAAYRNALFGAYRRCLFEKRIGVLQLAIYDTILMENLQRMSVDLSINGYEDGNTNIYLSVERPLYFVKYSNSDHKISVNAAVGYNSKSDLCYSTAKKYDSLRLIYRPALRLKRGSIALSLGAGYSFIEKEAVYSYGVSADYTIGGTASLELSCEETSSSYIYKEIRYCRFGLIKTW